jgi:hypothetical protein
MGKQHRVFVEIDSPLAKKIKASFPFQKDGQAASCVVEIDSPLAANMLSAPLVLLLRQTKLT